MQDGRLIAGRRRGLYATLGALTDAAYQFVSSATFAEACCRLGGRENQSVVATAAGDTSLVSDVCRSSFVLPVNSNAS